VLICATFAHAQGHSRNLFNGRNLSGWHVDVPARDSNARLRNPFIVRNGMLVSLGEPRGHLITNASYRNYRLEVEYRFPGAPGNSGVLVHASTPRALYGMFPRSIEVQMEHGNAGDFWCILEDIRVPDMERRRGPPATWGTTEGKARRILNLTDSSEKPVGEWNTMVIEAVGRSIRVWVNGDLVNDGSHATADRGQIALQAEGSEVEFRKLALTPISKLTSTAAGRNTTDNSIAAYFRDTAAATVFSAEGETFKVPAQRKRLRATLKRERALWQAARPNDYRFLLRVECFCPGTRGWLLMEVRDAMALRAWERTGQPAAVTDWNTFSIDGLYEILERELDTNGEIQTAFDARWHFPKYVRTRMLPGPDAWSITEVRALRPI